MNDAEFFTLARNELTATEVIEIEKDIERLSDEILEISNHNTRGSILIERMGDMPVYTSYRVLGLLWTAIDRQADDRATFREMLEWNGPVSPMMTSEEHAEYDLLPELVTVYRGCDLFDASNFGGRGLSWTLDEAIARKFVNLARYMTPYPVLFTAQAKKEDIKAFMSDREEREVIVTKISSPTIERLPRCARIEYPGCAPWSSDEDMYLCAERVGKPCLDDEYLRPVGAASDDPCIDGALMAAA